MIEHRYVRHGIAGPTYRVTISPRELPQGGIDPDQHAIVFEEISGREFLTTRLHRIWALEELTEADLEGLLEDARK